MCTAASWKQQLFQIEQGSCREEPSTKVQVSQFHNSLVCVELKCIVITMKKKYRQLRGEDLQGLNIEELQQLERSLETGLGRVIEKKVFNNFVLLLLFFCSTNQHNNLLHDFIWLNLFPFQGEKIMNEITDLQRKVRHCTSRYLIWGYMIRVLYILASILYSWMTWNYMKNKNIMVFLIWHIKIEFNWYAWWLM